MIRPFVGAIALLAFLAIERSSARTVAAPPSESESSFDFAAFTAQRTRVQAALRQAVAAFDASFTAANAQNREGWRHYLNWNAWAQPLLDSAEYRLPEMRRIAWRLYAPREGFEHPQVVALRDALADYVTMETAAALADGDLESEHARRLAQLRRAAATQPLDFAALEDAAWWLGVAGQAPAELAALRAQFNQPPVVLQVHRDLVEEKLDTFQRTAAEQRHVRQQIQGAAVVGTANVNSRTTAHLVEAPGEARLRIITEGTVAAPHNVSTHGRVRVASAANSRFTATADIYWNGSRFVATALIAAADTTTRVKSIAAPRLIRRAARRRVQASRGAAQAESESRIERDAAQSMTEQLNRAVDKLNGKASGFLSFLARTGDPVERWTTAVRPGVVEVGYTPRCYSGLAARPHRMPPLERDETLGLSFHSSAFENLFRAQLAGKPWTDVDFSVMQRELTGANTHQHMIGLEPERWQVQWSWRRPLSIHFTRTHAVVCYRFDSVEIDGYESVTPFEVRADIHATAPPLGFEMRLLAPARIVSLDANRPLPPQTQSFLERKFRGLFSERFSLDNLQFPAGGHLDGMSRFRVASIRHDDQWIHLRYTNRALGATQAGPSTAGSAESIGQGDIVAR